MCCTIVAFKKPNPCLEQLPGFLLCIFVTIKGKLILKQNGRQLLGDPQGLGRRLRSHGQGLCSRLARADRGTV